MHLNINPARVTCDDRYPPITTVPPLKQVSVVDGCKYHTGLRFSKVGTIVWSFCNIRYSRTLYSVSDARLSGIVPVGTR